MSGTQEEILKNVLLNSEMVVDFDLGKHFPDSRNGEQDFDHELSSLYTPQASDDGILSLQVLEFKTSLIEAVEELHIHRDAEMRFEEQINKFVLEKQKIEWEKESLQHQIDTLVHQHNESLAAQKKQFQARIADIEGEKGKHQLSAELKDREIIRLKEEMKLLQLFKYSLQKKLSELEQKLKLQVQTKDSHLSQLGEVERRFGALSRQCTTVKQAHEKLVQNVEEALRLNKKLTTVNKQQETAINSLKQDVEKAKREAIKSKVSSACKSGEQISPHIVKEQQMQHKLNMETEINKGLMKENAAIITGKQEVLNTLLQTQQLLVDQTEALSQAEQELSVRSEEHWALKTEHKLFQEKIQEKEGHIDSLMEDHNKAIAEWKNEEKILREKLTTDQEELQCFKETYGFPHKLSFRTEHTQCDLMELKKNNRNSEICIDVRCKTKDRPGENASLQGHGDSFQLQVSTKHATTDCDEIVNGQAPDKGSGAGSVGPGETASSEGSQADLPPTATAPPPTATAPPPTATALPPTAKVLPPTAMALPPTTTALPPTIMAFPPPASPHSLRGGAPAAHAADALAAIVGQERVSRQLQSHSSVRSPVYSVPDNGSSPSHNMCQEGGFNSEPGGPAGVPAHHLDCDPTGGGRQGRKQDEKASIPKTAIQTTNKDGRGSQESAGSEHAERGETAASEVHLNQPGFLETNHSGAPQKPTEHHGGMLENKAKSDINPFSSQAEQDSMLASDDQTVMDKSQLTPTGDVSSTNKAWGHACSPAMGRACDVDLNAKPDTSSVGVRALSHHSDPMANRISGPEFESTVTTSGASEPKSADRAEEKFEGRTSFERRENAPTKESSSVTRPRTADMPDTLDVESVPPESSGPDPSQHREGKGKQPHEETSGAPALGNKRFRSSFELELLTKAKGSPCHFLGFVSQMKGDQTNDQISRSLTPSKPSFLKTKTQLRPGFQGFLSSITVSMLQKDKPISRDSPAIKRAADMLNASSIHPGHKRDRREEWNAIAQTFCETPAGLELIQAKPVYNPSRFIGSDIPAPFFTSMSIPPRHPSPAGHAAEGVAPGPRSDGKEQSKISPHQ